MIEEWMIVPDVDIAVEIGSSFHKGDKYTNLDLVKITGRLYQRKLLEYLDETRAIDMHVTIASMLKQLEGQK